MSDVQVIDLFSGCGGMSSGFIHAETNHISYQLLGGLDVDKHANATYKKMLGRPALNMPIEDLLVDEKLNNALKLWEYDSSKPLILIGCAPCQGFSSHRKKDVKIDGRNALIEIFGKVVQKLLPEVVVVENVPELLYSKHWSYFKSFKDIIEDHGYSVRSKLHNAAEYGVPQDRYRALVIASRDASKTHMPEPVLASRSFRTVRDAIGGLPPLAAGETCAHDAMHRTSKHRESTIDLLKAIPLDGGSRSALPEEMIRECHKTVDGFRDVYGRLWWDRPAVAITARCRTPSCGRFTHPEQHRGLSIREAALLQSFPKDWVFEGPFDDKYKQIGNAVPPLFAKAIAETIDFHWVGSEKPSASDMKDDILQPIGRSISSSIASWKKKAKLKQNVEVAE